MLPRFLRTRDVLNLLPRSLYSSPSQPTRSLFRPLRNPRRRRGMTPCAGGRSYIRRPNLFRCVSERRSDVTRGRGDVPGSPDIAKEGGRPLSYLSVGSANRGLYGGAVTPNVISPRSSGDGRPLGVSRRRVCIRKALSRDRRRRPRWRRTAATVATNLANR